MASELRFYRVSSLPDTPKENSVYFVETSEHQMQTFVTGFTSADVRRQGGYVHEQVTPAPTWSINHNLGSAPMAVTVIDTDGNNLRGFGSTHTKTETVLDFGASVAGTAKLI